MAILKQLRIRVDLAELMPKVFERADDRWDHEFVRNVPDGVMRERSIKSARTNEVVSVRPP